MPPGPAASVPLRRVAGASGAGPVNGAFGGRRLISGRWGIIAASAPAPPWPTRGLPIGRARAPSTGRRIRQPGRRPADRKAPRGPRRCRCAGCD